MMYSTLATSIDRQDLSCTFLQYESSRRESSDQRPQSVGWDRSAAISRLHVPYCTSLHSSKAMYCMHNITRPSHGCFYRPQTDSWVTVPARGHRGVIKYEQALLDSMSSTDHRKTRDIRSSNLQQARHFPTMSAFLRYPLSMVS